MRRALVLLVPLLLLGSTSAAPAPLAAQEEGGTGVERTPEGMIRIDFQGTELPLAVAALAEAAGLNVVFGELPRRPVTLRTTEPVDAAQARRYLESVLRAANLKLEDEDGVLRIVPADPPAPAPAAPPAAAPGGPVRVYVHPLRHAPAEDLARTLSALFGIGGFGYGGDGFRSLSEDLRRDRVPPLGAEEPPAAGRVGVDATLEGAVQIVPDLRTNSLLIRAAPEDYQVLRAAIEQLDSRPLQVLIEVLIAEVRRNREFALGVDIAVPDQREPRSGAIVGGDLLGASTGDVVLRIMELGGVNADVALSALAASGEATVLSRPVILAQNNEQARILVGTQRPFIQISRSLPTDAAVRDQVVQYREVGTQLTIRPTVNPDGYVTLSLLQEVSSATQETQFGAPIISTREAETRLLVRDGHAVVIGGLVDHQRSSSNSGVPLLRDIPLLGALFRSSRQRSDRTELFLLLIPHVLRTDEEVDRATERLRENSRRLDRALPDPLSVLGDPPAEAEPVVGPEAPPPSTPAGPAAPPTPPAEPPPAPPQEETP